MNDDFFSTPILNSPYEYPSWHWKLDETGQPTQEKINSRRRAEFISPIPQPKKQKAQGVGQSSIIFDEVKDISTPGQDYFYAEIINGVRDEVDRWRNLKNPKDWHVTLETEQLLIHWRKFRFSDIRPFFCQIEAVETAIWLTEVAPRLGARGKKYIDHIKNVNNDANPDLIRIALKMATGAGKTTVMAMLIAWQTVNSIRHPQSKRFTRGFLVVAPGITIRDRLRVLQPNDPDSYFKSRQIVPQDMLSDLERAKIVITNFHSFIRRDKWTLSKVSRSLLEGRDGPINTKESEGQMLQRVMPELMSMKNILVINDEAHHCYRQKFGGHDEQDLSGDQRKEAEKNSEQARVWISGLEVVKHKLGIIKVFDLSATPFFLSGSGYAEGTLFPWTMCDFSLMDAIECGIVKLPRLPIADNTSGSEMPVFRDLWQHIGKKMPTKGRSNIGNLDPLSLPVELQAALEALYGHYKKTFNLWQANQIDVPPCFIVVCNNTSTSKLVYDYISGFHLKSENTPNFIDGHLPLFRNFDEAGNRYSRPRTLLIDSEQLESGDALDKNFRAMAEDEIERYRREMIERGEIERSRQIGDEDLLREVMNTVGKRGRLGETIRCVVSVSMLSEGWDANTVTHILGVRAFGTQLLCEQVVGRALCRHSYELDDEDGLLKVEYADVLGIPFDFASKPVLAPPHPPRETIHVYAVRPDRDALEIRFPRVAGYRVELPKDRLNAEFTEESFLELTPELVGPTITQNAGILGEGINLNLDHLSSIRRSTLVYELTKRLLYKKWRDPDENPHLPLFGQLKSITRHYLDTCLSCKGGTYPAQLLYQELADMVCERITAAITRAEIGNCGVRVVLDPYNSEGSTAEVNFNSTKSRRYRTCKTRCHVNWAILDSDWEVEFCRIAEAHSNVLAYARNDNLGLEVPYRYRSRARTYLPDFIVKIDDGHGPENPLNLVLEIKGYRKEDAKDKKNAMDTYWIPGVNNLGRYGRWAFAEFRDVWEMNSDFEAEISSHFESMIQGVVA